MRDPARIARIVKLLTEAWAISPDLRIGQLLECLRGSKDLAAWQIEDDVWERKLRWMISLGFSAARETL